MSSSHPTPKKWKPDTPHLLWRQTGKERGGRGVTAPQCIGHVGEKEVHLVPAHGPCPSPGTADCLPGSFNYVLQGLQTKAAKQPPLTFSRTIP